MRPFLAGLRALLGRHRLEQDLDDELNAYLEATVEQNLAAGMSHDEAVRAARLTVGNIEAAKDAVRDVGWESRLESLWHDVRHALRGLRRSPGFTAAAILTLALGIGINTALFSVVNGLLLRTLPVTAPEELVVLSTRGAIEQGFPAGWTYPMWDQVRKRTDIFNGAIAWSVFPERFDLAQGGESQFVDGLFVGGNFFDELGVAPLLGRTLRVDEEILGSVRSHVAVISYGFWQRRFGGAADVVGRSLLVNRVPVTIVGVSPPEFFGPEVGRAFDIALPVGAAPDVLSDNRWGRPDGFSYLAVMLRLKHGQSGEETVALLRGLHRQFVEASMGPGELWGPNHDAQLRDTFALLPAATGTSELRRNYSQSIVAILAIAMLVLLIACANIANLFQARAASRHLEISTRLAIGASRARIVQQVLVESLVLSAIGAASGLLLAVWGSRLLVASLSTWFDRVVLDVSLDWRVLAFAAAMSAATALLFGIMPAIFASRVAPGAAMKVGSVRSGRAGVFRVRGGLIAAQVAMSLVLLVAAGLLIRSFSELAAVPLGFDSDRTLVVRVNASRAMSGPGNRPDLYQRLVDALVAVPGVTHAAASLNTPVNRGATLVADLTVPGGVPIAQHDQRVVVNYVTPGWFEAYGVVLRQGRAFDGRDSARSMPVIVASDAFVQRFLSDRPAVGSLVSDMLDAPSRRDVPKTIVGVVGDVVDQSLRNKPPPTVYIPLAQFMQHPFAGTPFMSVPEASLTVRAATGATPQLGRGVAAALTAIEPNLSFSFQLLADQVDAARHQERLVAWLSGLFALLALVLAAVGLYGVTSYAVARRRTEIGIRMALGAQRHDVVGLAIRNTIFMTMCGIFVGLTAAGAVTRYLQALLFGISPLDLISFLAAPLLLVLVALLACYVPARRAATVDPMNALRCE
jgi:predicted permease